MSDSVQFDEDNFSYNKPASSIPNSSGGIPISSYNHPVPQENISGIAKWLIKKGIAKTPQTANYILFGIVVINIIITIVVMVKFL